MDWFRPNALDVPMQKQVVLLLLRLLLELSLACLMALASSLCCSCSVNVGTVLVTGPACCGPWKCCGQILFSGRFLFVSVIVVGLDSLLQTPAGTVLQNGCCFVAQTVSSKSCVGSPKFVFDTTVSKTCFLNARV